MGALEGLGGQILDTFVKSEGWGGGPGAEVTGAWGFHRAFGRAHPRASKVLKTIP